MDNLLEIFLMPKITAQFPSKAAFADAVLPHKNTNTAAVHLAMILSGKRPAPVDHLEAWIHALDLDATGTEEFCFLAGLTHLPEKLHPLFIRLFNESRVSRGLSALAARPDIGRQSPKKKVTLRRKKTRQ